MSCHATRRHHPCAGARPAGRLNAASPPSHQLHQSRPAPGCATPGASGQLLRSSPHTPPAGYWLRCCCRVVAAGLPLRWCSCCSSGWMLHAIYGLRMHPVVLLRGRPCRHRCAAPAAAATKAPPYVLAATLPAASRQLPIVRSGPAAWQRPRPQHSLSTTPLCKNRQPLPASLPSVRRRSTAAPTHTLTHPRPVGTQQPSLPPSPGPKPPPPAPLPQPHTPVPRPSPTLRPSPALTAGQPRARPCAAPASPPSSSE